MNAPTPATHIIVTEVGTRDGFQAEPIFISTERKVEVINGLIDAGVQSFETTSFVSPRAVPQMADASEVMAHVQRKPGVRLTALVPNARGAERAAAAQVDMMACFVSASETHCQANLNKSRAAALADVHEFTPIAQQFHIPVRGAVATAFGCPFEGEVAQDRVVAMAVALADAGPVEIGLADTIGVGNPAQVSALVAKVRAAVPHIPVRVHFHNTRGTGLANVWAAIAAGAVTVDASIGGLGGCPFAPGAAGNVSTEDVVYMLERAGVRTGLDLSALVSANHWLGEIMQRTLPGMVAKAPPFPKQA